MGIVAADLVPLQPERDRDQAAERAARLQRRSWKNIAEHPVDTVWREGRVTAFLDFIGRKVLYCFRIVGEVLILLWRTLLSFREAPRNLTSILTQMTIIGYETLPVAT